MTHNQPGPAGNRNSNKATPAGLLRELVFWPLLVFGALGYTVFGGPNHLVILVGFFLSVLIIITTSGKQRLGACWVMVAFALANAWHIHHPAPQMFQEPQFWFVNRLLYAVGLAFYAQPILDKVFDNDKGRERALVIAPLLILAAFLLYWISRPDYMPQVVECVEMVVETSRCTVKVAPGAWYTPDQLYDDVLVGIASGLIFGALSGSAKARKKKTAGGGRVSGAGRS